MQSYRLHTDKANFRSFKILIAAEYCGVDINVVETTTAPAASLIKKLPVLEVVGSSCIANSNAIARYVSKLRADAGLCGSTIVESAQVDSWIDFCSMDIELPATIWYYPVIGYFPSANSVAKEKAKKDLATALGTLNTHLAEKTYLVGEKITLADITIASALVYPFKFVADPKYRTAFPNVMRWFDTCVNQSAFTAVIGKVVLAQKELEKATVPSGPDTNKKDNKKDKKEKKAMEPKPEKAPKPKEEKKPKKEEDGAPPVKKEEHIFKIMDKEKPSPFVMDTWKKTYSNCSDYQTAMNTFFEMFDAEGWSIYRGDYKFNEENKVLFMTSNLIGGFIQRTDEIRKWLFGTCTIRGEEGGLMKITHYFLIRGQEIEPLIKCNDDAEQYNWTKLATPVSEADKKQLYDYWCSEGPLDGEACLDSRVYK